MADKLKLPVGIEDFREIRRKDFYYIDKTRLISNSFLTAGKGKSFYKASSLWKDLKYEHAPLFF